MHAYVVSPQNGDDMILFATMRAALHSILFRLNFDRGVKCRKLELDNITGEYRCLFEFTGREVTKYMAYKDAYAVTDSLVDVFDKYDEHESDFM